MVAQSATLGATNFSPFSSTSGSDYVSPYIPRTHYTSPLSGAFSNTGTPGYSTGAGVRGTEVVRSDNLYYRPIFFYSVAVPFTAASSTVRLMVTATISGGNRQPVAVGDAATVTWDYLTAVTSANPPQLPMQYAVSQCTTADAAVTYYAGFYKSDANTTTFRRGVTSGTPAWAPDEIYVNGTKSSTWTGTSVRTTMLWWHVPNHPTSLTASSGSQPGEVDLSWTAPSDNGGRTIYGYRIAYKKSGDSTWYVYGTNTNGSPSKTHGSATSETVRGLTPGSSYSFVVSALNIVCDRYQGTSVVPDAYYADFTATTAHTGQNSNIATGTAASMPAVTPKFAVHNGTSFVAAAPKAISATSPSTVVSNATPFVYDGSKFTKPIQITASSSNVSTSTYTSGKITYTVHSFYASGELVIKEAQNGLPVDYLIVGGGGQGGYRYMGGGGGAGGLVSGSTTLTSYTTYPVIVGAGGDITLSGGFSAVEGSKGASGGNSSFAGVTAIGGGGGGSWINTSGGDAQGLSGGSGGGMSGYNAQVGVAASSGTAGQGNAGGSGLTYGAGGGGGAGAAGSNGTTTTGGNGGAGVTSSITGSGVIYAGGGGGGSYSSATASSGGSGGGGNGAPGPNNSTGGVPTAGTNGLGGGGGGANGYGTTGATTPGGVGGSGVVIIRYISSIAP